VGKDSLQVSLQQYLVVNGTLLHQTFTRVSSDACMQNLHGKSRS
jgi:hypothetical protein